LPQLCGLFAVHGINSVDIVLTHFNALPHDHAIVHLHFWHNRFLAIYRERRVTVVHNRAIIVGLAKHVDGVARVSVEIVLGAMLDVLPHDVNEIISIRCALRVVKAQGVNKLVHDGAKAKAPGLDSVRLQIQLLTTALHANARPTAAILALCAQRTALIYALAILINLQSPKRN
jgi:hypothetical protein